ncbi:MAG: DUF2490 domain-containing protein [Bacteroidetes bacterium]|nr:DUF2490 domain-containing protein [Bacteroidota bacterium]
MKNYLLILFLLVSGICFSQFDDAQLWENIYLEKNITQRWVIHMNEEGRITENITRPSYIYTDWGITYKACKHLHFTLAYVPIAKKQIDDYVSFRHQFYFDFTLKKKIHRFTFYDRQMFQNQYNDILRSPNWNIPSYYLRNKVTIKYNTKKDFIPYVAEEIYFQWNNSQPNGKETDRMRYYAGVFYEKDLINEFELYYLVEPHYHISQPFTNWIIGIGYARKLYW